VTNCGNCELDAAEAGHQIIGLPIDAALIQVASRFLTIRREVYSVAVSIGACRCSRRDAFADKIVETDCCWGTRTGVCALLTFPCGWPDLAWLPCCIVTCARAGVANSNATINRSLDHRGLEYDVFNLRLVSMSSRWFPVGSLPLF
jgi:hypothetical protein